MPCSRATQRCVLAPTPGSARLTEVNDRLRSHGISPSETFLQVTRLEVSMATPVSHVWLFQPCSTREVLGNGRVMPPHTCGL